MHTSKFVLALLIALAASQSVRAQETVAERQQKAIEVLRQVIADENQKKALTQHAQSPAAKPAAAEETADQRRARELLRQKMNEGQSKSSTPSSTVVTGTLKPSQVSAAPAVTAQARAEMAPARPSGDTPDQARAREVLRQAMASGSAASSTVVTGTLSAQGASEPAAKAKPAAKEKPAKAKTVAKKSSPAPEAAPAAPAGPKTKQDKLADLLGEYKADKITPTEYHQRRAVILAE